MSAFLWGLALGMLAAANGVVGWHAANRPSLWLIVVAVWVLAGLLAIPAARAIAKADR